MELGLGVGEVDGTLEFWENGGNNEEQGGGGRGRTTRRTGKLAG